MAYKRGKHVRPLRNHDALYKETTTASCYCFPLPDPPPPPDLPPFPAPSPPPALPASEEPVVSAEIHFFPSISVTVPLIVAFCPFFSLFANAVEAASMYSLPSSATNLTTSPSTTILPPTVMLSLIDA